MPWCRTNVAYRPGPPTTDPSNRWPWLALALGLLIVIVAAGVFFFNAMRGPNVAIVSQATPTPVAIAAPTIVTNASPPPTLVAPTLSTVPTPTAQATPTSVPVASPPPGATFLPGAGSPQPTGPAPTLAPPPAVQTAAAAGGTPAPTGQPASAAPTPATQPTSTPAPASPTPAPTAQLSASPSPTPFSGQVSPAGGLGNTRQDLDAAVGPPTGETPGHLVVYRKNNVEEHVQFSPDPPRAMLIAETPPTPVALDAAQSESRRFFPSDAQPRAAAPEGNAQFVVERFASPKLGQALPANLFQQRNGQPGDFLVVYLKNPQGAISRIVVGIGNDINALIQRSGQ